MENTICHHLVKSQSRESQKSAVRYKHDKDWISLTWPQYFEKIEQVACGLWQIGLKPQQKVVIFANTSLEWSLYDFATLSLGCTVVPVYHSSTADDLLHILNDCQPEVVVIENLSLYRLFLTISERCQFQPQVILLHGEASSTERSFTQSEILGLGQTHVLEFRKNWLSGIKKIKMSDTATLLYTSGTTGLPKGVVLTHAQIMSEISEAFAYLGVNPSDRSLSFLPYSHILGRIENWGHMYVGFEMCYAESIDKIRNNLLEVRPTILIAVPRIFEKIYSSIQTQLEVHPIKKRLFKAALFLSYKASRQKIKRESLTWSTWASSELAQKLVLKKAQEAFGGQLRFSVCGGAPLSSEISHFFHACGLLVLEGYGLTETTAAICVNSPHDYRFGSVGKPFGDVQIRFAEDGEILVKSQKVMIGYYKNESATREAFEDGWFKTGDIGEFLESGDLKITDRKKDLIKTGGGKYVAPQKLENLLKLNPLISQVLIHGDEKKFIVALITLDSANLTQWANQRKISYSDFSNLTQNLLVLKEVRMIVAEVNSTLSSFESIKKFSILRDDFTIEAGELTPSLKVKRKFLDQKFKAQIEALYK